MSKGTKRKSGAEEEKVSGRRITVKIDDKRSVHLFRQDDGGGFMITGVTQGQDSQSIRFSEQAMAVIVAMYEEFQKEFSVWTVQLKRENKA